jgi:hypothetical protein
LVDTKEPNCFTNATVAMPGRFKLAVIEEVDEVEDSE